MKFEDEYRIVYCKDESYNNEYDNDDYCYDYNKNINYFKGYLIHYENGPAITFFNGTKKWFLNGKRHRVNGPAIEYASGYNKWYINGETYSEKEYKIINKCRVLDDI